MIKMGFHGTFVDLILRCVSSVSYQVLINGYPGESFQPRRGLRQGDPLSPYLFLFCAETLSNLLRRAEERKILNGARVCRGPPAISHLLFADDCIIFGRANENEIQVVKHIFEVYEAASGQKVNLDKSDIFFSKGVQERLKESLANSLGVSLTQQPGKYLGIPSIVGRGKNEIFQMLIDRVRKKTKDWKRRFLSGAGKEILIKSVVQTIPTYLMSCFLIPEQTCQRLNSLSAAFFWGQKHNERRIHWRNWRKMCCRKDDGGLGFRELSLFNKAMLAKQVWRLMVCDNSLLARSLKARYFPRCHVLQANKAHNPSFAWRSLLAGMDILREGLVWRVGKGDHIRIGLDRWIPVGDGKGFRRAEVGVADQSKLVKDFIDLETGQWDEDLLDLCFSNSDLEIIKTIHFLGNSSPDFPFWPFEVGGLFSVRSGYHFGRAQRDRREASSSFCTNWNWRKIWKLQTVPKVKLFLWKCLTAALPTKAALLRRSIPIDPICHRCGEDAETQEHVLRDCPWAQLFWKSSPLRIQPLGLGELQNFESWCQHFLELKHPLVPKLFATLLWSLWYARNMSLFQGKFFSQAQCFEIAQRHVWNKNSPVTSLPLKPRFVPCKAGFHKFRCDAAVKEREGVGVGVLVMEDSGFLNLCRAKCFRLSLSAEEGECLAVQEALRWAKTFHFSKIIIEMDCQSLHTKLTSRKVDRTFLGQMMDEVWMLANDFEKMEFSWISRKENLVSDSLAKFALSNHYFDGFSGVIPHVCFPV